LPLTQDGIEVFGTDMDDASVAKINNETKKIITRPELSAIHELAKASLRGFKYKVIPHRQFDTLSKQLNDYRKNPSADNVLGDWCCLVNYFLDGYSQDENSINLYASMRFKYDFLIGYAQYKAVIVMTH